MRYAYGMLLRLYPNSYRVAFGREMATVFEEAVEDHRPRGLAAYAFIWGEFYGLIAGAFAMWVDEYMLRSRRRPGKAFATSLMAGAAVTAFFQAAVYRNIVQPRIVWATVRQASPRTSDLMLPLILAGGVLLFISVFAMAFVWNMQVIGTRAGRLKPVWMPGRLANARVLRRDQTLNRNSGGQRRGFYRRSRSGSRLSRAERIGQIYDIEDDHGADRGE